MKAAAGDCRLRPDSPCIDAGTNAPDLPATDLLGLMQAISPAGVVLEFAASDRYDKKIAGKKAQGELVTLAGDEVGLTGADATSLASFRKTRQRHLLLAEPVHVQPEPSWSGPLAAFELPREAWARGVAGRVREIRGACPDSPTDPVARRISGNRAFLCVLGVHSVIGGAAQPNTSYDSSTNLCYEFNNAIRQPIQPTQVHRDLGRHHGRRRA